MRQKTEKGLLIGYARVSTEDQELRLQIDALEAVGCWNIYKEHRSATRGKRPQLELALLDLREGDTLVVWKLDRLARNMRELYKIMDRIYASKANFRSLQENFEFSTPVGQLMLAVLGAVAQFEAAMTSARTAAGIKAIQARGIKYGAQMMLSEAKAKRLVKLRKEGMKPKALAEKFGISTGSVRNYVKRARKRRK